MKDLSVDIIKDNNYFIKSPFEGEIIRFFVDVNDKVEKNQLIALFKHKNTYIEIESDFSGVVLQLCVDIDEALEKWDDIAVIAVDDESSDIPTSITSQDYNIFQAFQQEILPKLIFNETEMFIKGIRHEKEKFIYFLLKEVYNNNDSTIPFRLENFYINQEVFNDEIIIIRIDWPNVEAPLLARRSYIPIHLETLKIHYYTCERSLEDEFIISGIMPYNNRLVRYNYGGAPETLELEIEKIINIFLSK